MNQKNDLREAADELGRMIEGSRAELAHGRTVDLSRIERKMAEIYGAISGDIYGAHEDRAALMIQLESLLTQLNALEADLTAHHQIAVAQ